MQLKKNCKQRLLILCTTISLMAGLYGCNSKGCYEDMNVRLTASFYSKQSSSSLTLDSVSVRGIGRDSLLYENETLSELELFLNPTSDTTRFLISIQQDGALYTDTLTFHHTNTVWFQSLECGYMVFNHLQSCSHEGSIFDSVVIEDSTVNNNDSEHVRIYF